MGMKRKTIRRSETERQRVRKGKGKEAEDSGIMRGRAASSSAVRRVLSTANSVTLLVASPICNRQGLSTRNTAILTKNGRSTRFQTAVVSREPAPISCREAQTPAAAAEYLQRFPQAVLYHISSFDVETVTLSCSSPEPECVDQVPEP